MILSESIN